MNAHADILLRMAHSFQCAYDGISSNDLRKAAAEIERLEGEIIRVDGENKRLRGDIIEITGLLSEARAEAENLKNSYAGAKDTMAVLESMLARDAKEIADLKAEAQQAKADRNRIGMEIRREFLPKLEALQAENERLEAETKDELRWLSEVLTDFRVPFDNHKIGMRVALVQELCDKRKEVEKLRAELAAVKKELVSELKFDEEHQEPKQEKVCEWTKNKIGNLCTTGCKGTLAPLHTDTDYCHRCGGKVVVR